MPLRTNSLYVLVLVAIMPLGVWLSAADSPDQQDPQERVLPATFVVEPASDLSSSPPDLAQGASVCSSTDPLVTPALNDTEVFPRGPSVVACPPGCPRNCCWFGICMCH